MQYAVVFEVAAHADAAPVGPIVFVASLVVGLLACAVWLAFGKRVERYRRFWPHSVALAIGLLLIAVAMFGFKTDQDSLLEAARLGNVRVVEGVVENFHPMPYAGHDTERFSVAGHRFEYSDYLKTSGFNQTSSHGGPIREGLPVRITYVPGQRNVIIKLEVGRT